jgi:ribosomal subunit interface protein
METAIQTQHVELPPDLRALIEARLARLDDHYARLVRVHVTVRHGGHHLRGTEEVAIVAACPGAVFRAAKQEENMRDAVHAAFEAIERELAGHYERRREFAKTTS